jgi:aminoglycoside 2'-N-acetyltransferase I
MGRDEENYPAMDRRPTIRRATTDELDPACLSSIKTLMAAAFGGRFSDNDWAHSLGGMHFLIQADSTVIAHASVIERLLRIGDRSARAGYVEAVATLPDCQKQGLGTVVMLAVGLHIREVYEIGALSTSSHSFYEKLSWERWQGPTFCRTDSGVIRTEEEDDGIMVLQTASLPGVQVGDAITCEWRPGDVW